MSITLENKFLRLEYFDTFPAKMRESQNNYLLIQFPAWVIDRGGHNVRPLYLQ